MSRVRPATASGTRKPRQLVEQFLEDAVELKPEKDLCAEDEKAAFVEGDLEFAFESHHRLRGDNVIAYAEPTLVGSVCKPALAGRQGPKRPDPNKTPAGDGRGSCVEPKGAGFPAPVPAEAGPMPTHDGLGPDVRDALEDRWEPSIQLGEEQAISVREPDATARHRFTLRQARRSDLMTFSTMLVQASARREALQHARRR